MRGQELDPGMEQGAVMDGDEIQIPEIGKNEMLFAVKSTLENVQDGTIEKEEYHLKLVTDGYNKQSGCLTDAEVPLDHCTVMVEKLTAIFNDVEMGLKNEDDYFFELISPSFFYTSGEYHLNEQMETTALAFSTIQEFESTKYHLDEKLQSMILELEVINLY
ncbi:uncharacterized protein LOC121412462 [Lytechinus variegatus]|uniref:uncharacterized protein LOC121412462 n=1 Tax=Lytechinus variegatus TaxID=7654 RepID=UPI001BB28AD6|nr:uncharacterized protein LOC121412462 [Lytechinus variegatus]